MSIKLSEGVPENPHDLNESATEPLEWAVHKNSSGWSLDRSAQRLFAGLPQTEPQSDLADLTLLNSSETKIELADEICKLGDWVDRCVSDTAGRVFLTRVRASEDICLDVGIADNIFTARETKFVDPMRMKRHDFYNRINNIHVNAELVRLWGRQREDQGLMDAAQRILDECEQAGPFADWALANYAEQKTSSCCVAQALPTLLYLAGPDEPALELRAAYRSQISTEVVLNLAQFLNRVSQATGRPYRCRFEENDSSDQCLDLQVRSSEIPKIAEQVLKSEWEARSDNQLSLPNLPQHTQSYRLSWVDELLEFIID